MAATENFRRKNDNCGKSFKKNRPKTVQSPQRNLNAYHLPGAAVVADCEDGALLAGVAAISCDALTSCVPCVVVASVIILLVVGEKAAISCSDLSIGVIGS